MSDPPGLRGRGEDREEDRAGRHLEFPSRFKPAVRWGVHTLAAELDSPSDMAAFAPRTALISGLITFVGVSTTAQEARPDDHEFDHGSSIEAVELDAGQIAGLVRLGKIWGFLKYHHPSVTGGGLQWDYELFRVLPDVLAARDLDECNAAILAWSRRLGEPEPGDPAPQPLGDNVHLRPELDWIRDQELLGGPLSRYLVTVHRNRHRGGNQHYVDIPRRGPGNPVFDAELAYGKQRRPDAGYRLLALFRFWNIIEYWFPYRDLIDEDRDDVLAEFVPRLFRAEGPDDYALQLMALIARVKDTHANLWSSLDLQPPRGLHQLPVDVRFIEDKAVVTRHVAFGNRGLGGAIRRLLGSDQREPADRKLEIGDVILALDGVPVERLVEEWSPFYAASNVPTRLRDIGRSLTRGENKSVQVKVDRDGQVLELDCGRVSISALDRSATFRHDMPGDGFGLLSEDVAYLKLSSVEGSKAPDYVTQADGTKGLVIDIRNYPSDFVVFSLGALLLSEPTEFARFTQGDLGNPGAFSWTAPLSLTPAAPRYEGKVVILIDEASQSQAEYTTMALRSSPGAIVVGSTTAGADGNVSRIPLPGGLQTMISGIGVFYPDKSPTQRVGIIPDIEALPTIAGIRAGRDEVLEVALREILGGEAAEQEIRDLARVRD